MYLGDIMEKVQRPERGRREMLFTSGKDPVSHGQEMGRLSKEMHLRWLSSNRAEELEPQRRKRTSLLIIIPEIQGIQNISLSIS